MKHIYTSVLSIITVITIAACIDNQCLDLSPCAQAFHYNRNVDAANASVPYMKTCGLNIATSKFLHDAYSQVMSVNQAFVDVIYDELEIADQLLTEHNIPYYIVAGTLLGAIRNGGLIPNDDDMDIAVEIKYEKDLLALSSGFEANGFELKTVDFLGYKLKKRGSKSNGLDIFITGVRSVNGKDVLAYARDIAYNNWPNEWVEVSATANLTSIPFGHLKVNSVGITDAIGFLDRAYGNDWYTFTYKDFDHVNNRKIASKKERLLPSEYYHLVHGGIQPDMCSN